VAPPWLKPLNAPECTPAGLCDAANPRCAPAPPLKVRRRGIQHDLRREIRG
jgi:hypothetical protein